MAPHRVASPRVACRLIVLILAVVLAGLLPGRPSRAVPLPINGVERLRLALIQNRSLTSDDPDILNALIDHRRQMRQAVRQMRSLGDVTNALLLQEWGLLIDIDTPVPIEKILAAVQQPDDEDCKRDLQNLMKSAGDDSSRVVEAALLEIKRTTRQRLLHRLDQRLHYYLSGTIEIDPPTFLTDPPASLQEEPPPPLRIKLSVSQSSERIAAANLISEIMSNSRAEAMVELPGTASSEKTVQHRGISSASRSIRARLQRMSGDLVRLTHEADPQVQVAAIRALSNLETNEAIDALKPLLNGEHGVVIRRAAAEGFAHMATISNRKLEADESRARPQPVLRSLERMFPAAAGGLRDEDVEVRRASLTACRTAVTSLYDLVLGNRTSESESGRSGDRLPELSPTLYKPMLAAVENNLGNINQVARDPVPALRLGACQMLETWGKVWRKVHPSQETLGPPMPPEPSKQPGKVPPKERRGGAGLSFSNHGRPRSAARPSQWAATRSVPPTSLDTPRPLHGDDCSPPAATLDRPIKLAAATASAPATGSVRPVAYVARQVELPAPARLDPGLKGTIEAMIAGLSDPDYRVRLGAVEVLETLGDRALPAVPALVKALRDRDKFVRWASARTLGRLAPLATKNNQAREVVKGLMGLFDDREDLYVRRMAANAIERYGPAAEDAVPLLARVIHRGDKDYIVAVLRALQGIGTAAQPALPNVAWIMGRRDLSLSVRLEAAQTLGRFGPLARGQLPQLHAIMVGDPSEELRNAASSATLAIKSPE